jgi:hypothetical protein
MLKTNPTLNVAFSNNRTWIGKCDVAINPCKIH